MSTSEKNMKNSDAMFLGVLIVCLLGLMMGGYASEKHTDRRMRIFYVIIGSSVIVVLIGTQLTGSRATHLWLAFVLFLIAFTLTTAFYWVIDRPRTIAK